MRKGICIAALLCSLLSFGQTQRERDSLVQLIPTAKDDTNKVWLLLRTGRYFRDVDLKAAHNYIDQGGVLSNQLNFLPGQFQTNIQKAGLFRAEGRNDSVLHYNKKSLDLATLHKDSFQLGIAYLNLSESYSDFSDEATALEMALKGLAIIESSGREPVKEDAYAQLLRIYVSRYDYVKALEYGEKAIAMARKLKSPQREALTLYNIGYIYIQQRELDKALDVNKKFLALCKEIENERYEGYAYGSLAEIYQQQHQIVLARENGQKSLFLARKTGDRQMEGTSLMGLAIGYLLDKNYRVSRIYADSAMLIHQEMNSEETINSIRRLQANIYYATDEPLKAHTIELEHQDYLTKNIRQVLNKQSADLEKKYETEKKEEQIRLQQTIIRQKNWLNYALMGSAVTLMIMLILVYRNHRNRQLIQQQRINELETQQQLTATEAILKGEEQERSRLAKDLHDGLGGLLSGVKLQLGAMKGNLILTEEHGRVFNNALSKLDESIAEMRRVAHNMMPEALMKLGLQAALQDYCDSLSESQSFAINTEFYGLENRLPASDEIVVYRIVQELVNNAVKHSGATTILAQVIRQVDQLTITVEDNGRGFDLAAMETLQGAGIKNIRSRVQYLRGQMDIKSTSGKGTSIHIDCLIGNNG